MLFTSPEFFILLLITFSIYYLPFVKKIQVELLIISSFIFYAYYKPALLLLLIFSILINTFTSYWVGTKEKKYQKPVAIVGVVINLLLLCFFKYSSLFAKSFLSSGSDIGHFLLTLPLPIGISFFTFEGISLLVDTFNNDVSEKRKRIQIEANPIKHLTHVAFFVSFFPHLISGPILKAYEFFPQISSKSIKDVKWTQVAKLLITGCFLKMVIADNLNQQTFYISYPGFLSLPSSTLIIQIFGYSFQIFSDFAGYSLIALGLASLFGYELNQNFNFPYISTSFSEFWRRWHISLSTFLKEYLYFPLGGNKKGKVRTYFNLFVVMFLGGLWHGAAWSYAVWGLFHGLALAIERLIKDYTNIKHNSFSNFLCGVMVFLFVSLAWLLFKLPDFSYAVKYIESIFKNSEIDISYFWLRINVYNILYMMPIVIYNGYYLYKQRYPTTQLIKYEFIGYGFMLFFILTNCGVSGDFIYFQF